MIKWSLLEEYHKELKSHIELLQIVEDSRSQQMLKSEEKIRLYFCMLLHICCIIFYAMDLKSIVSSLKKRYSGLDPDDATLCK